MTATSILQDPALQLDLLLFRDRSEAGRILAERLQMYAGRKDVIVLGLPRGGMPVAFEVAQVLAAPLDILLVRKLFVPGQPGQVLGSIASGGARVIYGAAIEAADVSPAALDRVIERETADLQRREGTYRGMRSPLMVEGLSVILIDDSLTTGSTVKIAVEALRKLRPARIVVSVPVAAPEAVANLEPYVHQIISVHTPSPFFSSGRWYRDFSPVMDREIRNWMEASARTRLVRC